jgi:hypothetical protein
MTREIDPSRPMSAEEFRACVDAVHDEAERREEERQKAEDDYHAARFLQAERLWTDERWFDPLSGGA